MVVLNSDVYLITNRCFKDLNANDFILIFINLFLN